MEIPVPNRSGNAAAPSRRKAFAWNAAGNWLSTVVFAVQGVVLVPLYIHFLGDRLYGFWLATGGIVAWLTMVDIGGAALTTQRCAAALSRGDTRTVVDYFFHGVLITAGVTLAFLGFLIPASSLLPSWIGVDLPHAETIRGCMLLIGVSTVFWLWNNFLRGFLAALQRNQAAALCGVGGELTGLCTTIFGLYRGWGLWAPAIGSTIRTALPFLVNAALAFDSVRKMSCRLRWSRDVLMDYVRTTPAILGAKACTQFLAQLPTILITRWVGPESTVLFSVTIRAAQLGEQALGSPLGALLGGMGHYLHDGTVAVARKAELIRRLSRAYVAAVVALAFMYSLSNHSFIGLWVGAKQFGSQWLTATAGIATAAVLCARFLELLVMAGGDVTRSSVIGVVERTVRVLLVLAATAVLGIEGPMLAMSVVLIAATPAYVWMLRRHNAEIAAAAGPLAWGWLPALVAVGAGSALSRVVSPTSWAAWILINAAIGSVCVATIAMIDEPTRLRVRGILGRTFQRKSAGGLA